MRAYRIAYDGRPFYGFQRQPDVPTVADALLDALVDHGELSDSDGVSRPTPPGYAAAGRTDAGVSALAQTVAFDAPDWLSPRAWNGHLPDDIRVWAVADVPQNFHATHDATERTYNYHLYAPDAEPDRATAAADALSGHHDFHNLTLDETGTERTLDCSITASDSVLRLTVTSGGFPRQLVRRLASVVRGVASGSMELDRIEQLLSPDAVPGPEGVPTAPPEPLVLADVSYPNAEFERDDVAVESARSVFGARRRRGVEEASVAETILDGFGGPEKLDGD